MAEEFVARVILARVHVALRVRDLDAALRFYHEDVGLPITQVIGPAENPTSVFVQGVQLMRVGEPVDARPGGSFDHVGIPLENLEEVCARLDRRGHVALTPLERRVLPGSGAQLAVAYYRDPEGNRVELFRLTS